MTADDLGALAVSGGVMTGSINMNGQPISGLNDPTEDTQAARKGYVDAAKAEANAYTDASVRKAAPRNILDNSDFTNLVAQTGIGGNHGTIAYAADRWILDSGTVSYEADVGLTLNGTIRQKIEHQPAGKTSAFCGMASGAASISYADGAVTITSSGGVLKWAALYEGEYTAETLPEYQPKRYAAELAECQRYCYIVSAASNVAFPGMLFDANTVRMSIRLPVKMRVNPTVTVASISKLDTYTTGGAVIPTAYTAVTAGNNQFIVLNLTVPSGKTVGTPTVTRVNTIIKISADL